MKEKAVILLSGGIDSATTLAIAIDNGFEPCVMSFRYGQRHAVELAAAENVMASLGVDNSMTVDIDLTKFGGSALTDSIDVPKGRSDSEMSDGIPMTYVPARNTIFLSYALGWAEVIGAHDIFIGVTAVDYSGYPDCRPEFIEAFERAANLGTRDGVEGRTFTIHTPLIHLSKSEIITKGISLGLDYGLTHSCYDPLPDGRACGFCDSCVIRKKGFQEVGIPDPTRY